MQSNLSEGQRAENKQQLVEDGAKLGKHGAGDLLRGATTKFTQKYYVNVVKYYVKCTHELREDYVRIT